MNTTYRLGIDIGSTTVKIACLDDENQVVFSDYERHFANIRETLLDLIIKAKEAVGKRQYPWNDYRFRRYVHRQTLKYSFRTGSYFRFHRPSVFPAKNRCGDRARRRRCKNHLFFSGKY